MYRRRIELAEIALEALREQEKVATNLQPEASCSCKWISVEERLPEAGEDVLVCDARDAFLGMFFLDERKSDKVYFWHDGDGWRIPSDEVTHWMPLPELPKEE